MATTTQHLGMTLPGYADAADVAVINANTTILDNAVYGSRQMLAYVEESNIATKNHNSGELLVVGGQLFKATSNIAIGDSFVLDSNIETTTIAEEIGSGGGGGGGGGGGSSSIDYSTTEQIVGTWIDGKPLYERTIEISDNFSSSKYYVVTDADILLIEDGYYIATSSVTTYYLPLNYSETSYNTYTGYIPNTQSLFFRCNGFTSSKVTVRVRYTKTTD